MNKNYQRGVRFERSIIDELQESGYSALRTAGSHGFSDIFGISRNIIRLIQAKTSKIDKISMSLYSKDIKKILTTRVPDNCTRELWIKLDRQKPYKILIL